MPQIQAGLGHQCTVRLGNARRHLLGHFGSSVANVDLTARDVVLTSIQRNTLREAGDGVFSRSVRR